LKLTGTVQVCDNESVPTTTPLASRAAFAGKTRKKVGDPGGPGTSVRFVAPANSVTLEIEAEFGATVPPIARAPPTQVPPEGEQSASTRQARLASRLQTKAPGVALQIGLPPKQVESPNGQAGGSTGQFAFADKAEHTRANTTTRLFTTHPGAARMPRHDCWPVGTPSSPDVKDNRAEGRE
jgi:hypothetical protein